MGDIRDRPSQAEETKNLEFSVGEPLVRKDLRATASETGIGLRASVLDVAGLMDAI